MRSKLNFTIAGEPREGCTHTILDLCDYLTINVLQPLLARDGEHWDRRFMNFFTFDNSCDPLEPTGTILFRVPPSLAGRIGAVENAITSELGRLGILTAPFIPQPDAPEPLTFRLPIRKNPSVLLAPPPVNVAYSRGCVILRDLLGYDAVNGRYEFTANDLLQRVSSVTDEKIAACTSSPVQVTDGVKRIPSPIGMRAIRRCLDEIRQFALWATRHNYPTLAAT